MKSQAMTELRSYPIVNHRTVNVRGIDLFYREAGPRDAPVVLLLHGFPTSSHMFRHLIPYLGDRYHVIAPDFPGFGQLPAPDRRQFAYTFRHYAELMIGLLDQLGVAEYAFYSFDYGAPVGYRMALHSPGRITGMIVQNGNAYEEGLREFWDPIKAYWADESAQHRQAIAFITEADAVEWQYVSGVANPTHICPDNVLHDLALLNRPGNREIQLDLFLDYRTNIPLYVEFQRFFRAEQPPTLIVWGKNDKVFPLDGAVPYLRDLPNAEYHELETGHFVLEDQFDVAAPLIHDFLDRSLKRQ